jgi:transposase
MIRAFLRCCKQLKSSQCTDSLVDPAFVDISLDHNAFVCPNCNAQGKVKNHGSYLRNYIYPDNDKSTCIKITVNRVRCTSCDKTHAVLPLTVVPNSVFSIMFIAVVMKDYLKRKFSSIESLATHYQISLSSIKRIIKRFVASAKIFFGATEGLEKMHDIVCLLLSKSLSAKDDFLESFFIYCGHSFCET